MLNSLVVRQVIKSKFIAWHQQTPKICHQSNRASRADGEFRKYDRSEMARRKNRAFAPGPLHCRQLVAKNKTIIGNFSFIN